MKKIIKGTKEYKWVNEKTVNGKTYVLYKYSKKPTTTNVVRDTFVLINGKEQKIKGDVKEFWNNIK